MWSRYTRWVGAREWEVRLWAQNLAAEPDTHLRTRPKLIRALKKLGVSKWALWEGRAEVTLTPQLTPGERRAEKHIQQRINTLVITDRDATDPKVKQQMERLGQLRLAHKPYKLEVSWAVLSNSGPGFSIRQEDTSSEDGLQLHLSTTLLALWLTTNRFQRPYYSYTAQREARQRGDVRGAMPNERELSVNWHNGALYWNLWWPTDEWSRSWPQQWRHGHFDLKDRFFGRVRYTSYPERDDRLLAGIPTVIRMPEGDYPAVAYPTQSSWVRPRWPRRPLSHHWRGFTIAFDRPGCRAPQFAGKGENSWDLDDNSILEASFTTSSLNASGLRWACAQYRDAVLAGRARYGEPRDYSALTPGPTSMTPT